MELTYGPEFDRRCSLAEEAVSLARETGDARTLAEVLRQAFYAYWSAQTLDLRGALIKELSECAAASGDPALQFWAHQVESHVYVEGGELLRAQATGESARRIASELAQPSLKWFATFQHAGLELLCGDLAAAERIAERAFQIGQEAGEPDAILIYGIQLSFARRAQGRGEEIIAALEQRASATPGIVAVRTGLAWTLCWLDRRSEAAAILKEAASDRFEHILPGVNELTALVLYADVAAQTGDCDAASILHELIEPWADQIAWNGVAAYGHARMYLGLLATILGKHEHADQHLSFACEFQETNSMPLWAARAQLGWAEALAVRGDSAGAREHATRTLELSREHGYGLFEPRATALLAPQPAAEP